jgi:hypothetical protein
LLSNVNIKIIFLYFTLFINVPVLKTENKRHKLRERLDAKTIFFNSTFLTKLEETLNRDVLSLSGLDGNFDKDLMYLLILGVLLYIFVCHFPIKEKTTVKI